MIRIALPDDDRRRLEAVLRGAADAKLRHRVQVVLMAHRGRRHPDIAADTGTSPRSVQRWLNAYLGRGLDGLRPREAPGATPEPTPGPAPVLRQRVIGGPARHGLDRADRAYPDPADGPVPPRRPGQPGDGPRGGRRPRKGQGPATSSG